MAESWLDFERPVVELERKIEELRALATEENLEMREEIERLEKRASKLRRQVYDNLSRWQRVQLARHLKRPYTLDYISMMCDDFVELHGDRCYRDDVAVVGGLAEIGGRSVAIMGHQKGRDTKEKIRRNFGMPHPEGYRKALRIARLAAKFDMPIVSLVDTPGAYPGVGAEKRGQSEAIARNLREFSMLPVPIVVAIIGEGGSGGALAMAVGDRILMQENAIYSVISPEGCASILWRDASKACDAAEALKLTAPDLLGFGIIDGMVREPSGGAHRDPQAAARFLKESIVENLKQVEEKSGDELVRLRIEKFYEMGAFEKGA
jgi:acetyl-CoA carboxylase carboxyl transferase subunit alpha